MAWVYVVVDLEVGILSITIGGDAIEDGEVTSCVVVQEGNAVEESPIIVLRVFIYCSRVCNG